MISYKCAKCAEELESPDSLQGQRETCPYCNTINLVPSAIPHDNLQALQESLTAPEKPASVPLPAGPQPVPAAKLRSRRPAFAYCRSGMGILLGFAFFMPWIKVTCNNNTIMNPSGFNLATGILDPKTRGTMRMTDQLSKFGDDMSRITDPAYDRPGFGSQGRGLQPKPTPKKSDFSFWDPPKKDQPQQGEADLRSLAARIALCAYSYLVCPVLLVLSCVLLWGQVSSMHLRDPAWDPPIQRIITISAIVGLALILAFALLIMPAEIPPIIDIGFDWGFYLTICAIAGLVALLVMDWWKMKSGRSTRTRPIQAT
ncbi:MAG: hypothetical protein ACE15C_14950 [Phycisphaerae bacterium]